MNNFLIERKKNLEAFNKQILKREKSFKPIDIPKGLFHQCEKCGSANYAKTLEETLYVCPFCGNHFRIDARQRIKITIDNDSFIELNNNIVSSDPLSMPGYIKKLETTTKIHEQNEAFVSGTAQIMGIKVAIGVLDSMFLMGSMGSATGERITRLIEYATKNELPLIIFSASGGARMQEGLHSLMQMAKTSMAIQKHDEKGLFYLSVMTNPTTGGVAASFASLGDIIIAEKSALIGFAGARVIEQTIKQTLPQGFQTEMFQLAHGQVDMVVERQHMRKTIYELLKLHVGGLNNE